jgi:hypothetical protein
VGEGETGVKTATVHPSDRESLRRLDGEISNDREELGVLVAELDQRRHRALDLKGQLKRHVIEISLAGAALTAISVTVIWLAVHRNRRRARLISRAGRLGTAVSRMVAHPELVATGPTIPGQLFTAIAAAALGSVTRSLVAHGIEKLTDAVQQRPSVTYIPERSGRWQ